jgi:hypothetical protein
MSVPQPIFVENSSSDILMVQSAWWRAIANKLIELSIVPSTASKIVRAVKEMIDPEEIPSCPHRQPDQLARVRRRGLAARRREHLASELDVASFAN